MIITPSKILSKTGRFFIKLSGSIIEKRKSSKQKEEEKNIQQWFKVNGDKTLRLDYDLNKDSIVFDLGGYEGQWTSDVFSRYLSNIFVFEPYKPFAQNIENRFRRNSKIKIFNFGLSDKTTENFINVDDDASSIFRTGSKSERISLIRASEFILENRISGIDLMKINIEGGEYDLLDHLIESGIIKIIDNIQVQFHWFIQDAEDRMEKIHSFLKLTHYPTYEYKYVWENWKRKDQSL